MTVDEADAQGMQQGLSRHCSPAWASESSRTRLRGLTGRRHDPTSPHQRSDHHMLSAPVTVAFGPSTSAGAPDAARQPCRHDGVDFPLSEAASPACSSTMKPDISSSCRSRASRSGMRNSSDAGSPWARCSTSRSPTQDYLATYGAFFIHCGATAMGNPGPHDTPSAAWRAAECAL